jgi:hypothetical protein
VQVEISVVILMLILRNAMLAETSITAEQHCNSAAQTLRPYQWPEAQQKGCAVIASERCSTPFSVYAAR